MKLKLVLLMIGIGYLCSSCEEQECCIEPILYPDCIYTMIDEIKKEAVSTPPKEIYAISFEAKRYFYLPTHKQCCDMFSELYDEDCNLVCAPEGGVAGGGDGKCPEGLDIESLDKTLVFKDDR